MRKGLWISLAATAMLACLPAQASLIISVGSTSAAAGGSGAFDVTLENTGALQNIASFSLALSVAGASGITFTGANESTTLTYIFNGDSFDIGGGFPYSNVPPAATSLEASDLSNSGNGTNEGATTLGLGHILFSVASNAAAGPVTVAVTSTCLTVSNCTSLADSAVGDLAFAVNSGTITVTPVTSTPEPSSMSISLLAASLFLLRRRMA